MKSFGNVGAIGKVWGRERIVGRKAQIENENAVAVQRVLGSNHEDPQEVDPFRPTSHNDGAIIRKSIG